MTCVTSEETDLLVITRHLRTTIKHFPVVKACSHSSGEKNIEDEEDKAI